MLAWWTDDSTRRCATGSRRPLSRSVVVASESDRRTGACVPAGASVEAGVRAMTERVVVATLTPSAVLVLYPGRVGPVWGETMTRATGDSNPGDLAVLVQDGVPASSVGTSRRDGRSDALER
jgi:hypothetical protein